MCLTLCNTLHSKNPKYTICEIDYRRNVDICAASLLILYFTFPSLILSSIVMISFYILPKRFILKYEEISDARVEPIAKKRI